MILKIINFLNLLISTIFLRAINVFSIFDLRIRIIISIALIFCIRFISCFLLIYVINFISLFDFRFKEELISRKENVEIATFVCLMIIFVQVFSSIVSFVFSIIFFNFLIIFFSFVIFRNNHSFFLSRLRIRDTSRLLLYRKILSSSFMTSFSTDFFLLIHKVFLFCSFSC